MAAYRLPQKVLTGVRKYRQQNCPLPTEDKGQFCFWILKIVPTAIDVSFGLYRDDYTAAVYRSQSEFAKSIYEQGHFALCNQGAPIALLCHQARDYLQQKPVCAL